MHLSSRRRVETALDFQEPDRPPIKDYFTKEIHQKLKLHFRGRNLHDELGVDFRFIKGPKPLRKMLKREESSELVYDIWGVGYKETSFRNGSYSEAYHLPLRDIDSLDQVESYPWPAPDDYDYSVVRDDCNSLHNFAVCFGHAGIPDILNGVGRGRGHDKVINDIMSGNKVGVAIIDKRIEFWYEYCKRTLEVSDGLIDILWLGEDLGTQNGPFWPHRTFNDFFVPRIKRFYDLGHEFGAKVAMHSCGSTRLYIPDLIDMGLNILDAVQPEPVGMDPEGLKSDYGDKIVLCGLISTQNTLPFGTVEDCKREAMHRIRVIGKGGGYIFSPAHAIQPDTPIENVLAVYETAKSYIHPH